MPAGSDPRDRPAQAPTPPALPVRFRPLGVRLMAVVLAVLMTVLVTGIWLSFPPEVRASFTLVQRLTLLLIALVAGGVAFALARSRIDADDTGLTVVNGFREHRYEWNQVVAVTMRPGNPWAVLDLSDGTSQGAMGIQGSDGERAKAQVHRLRALVDARAGTEPGPTGPD